MFNIKNNDKFIKIILHLKKNNYHLNNVLKILI